MIDIPTLAQIRFAYPYLLLAIPAAALILILIISRDFVKFANKQEKQIYDKHMKGTRIAFAIFRCFVVALLLAALASPYYVSYTFSKGEPHATILIDNSSSFTVFNYTEVEKVVEEVKKEVPVKVRYIGSSDKSNIGDEIINKIEGSGMESGESIFLISDGYITDGTTFPDALSEASLIGSTINTLYLRPVVSDMAVTIEGPSINNAGTDTTFVVHVASIGTEKIYELKVQFDNESVESYKANKGNSDTSITKVLTEGYHTVHAWIETSDFISENNGYYKTVQIMPKKPVLLVTQKETNLKILMQPLYDLTVSSAIPSNLSYYYAVVLNDIPISDIEGKSKLINDFLAEDNGLVVIGGKNSYDKGGYRGSTFETVLPVKVGTGIPEGASGVNVVLLIDASQSFKGQAVDYAKAVAIDVITNARLQDAVGVIAFRSGIGSSEKTQTVIPLTRITDAPEDFKANVTEQIGRIIGGGGTSIAAGLDRSEVMLKRQTKDINIVIISDGFDMSPENAVAVAKQLADKGYKIYVIGYGKEINAEFLQRLAKAGNGAYFEPRKPIPVKIIFGTGDEGKDDIKKDESGEKVTPVDTDHFITRSLSIDAHVTGYNAVVPKASSRLLLVTDQGYALLTAWRYGLGRVAAWSTDDGSLWSGELFSKQNSDAYKRTVNWAIGYPSRKDDFSIEAEDTRVNEDSMIIVHSSQEPEIDNYTFVKVDDRMWSSKYTPKKRGVIKLFYASVSVNYQKEYENLGMNPDFIKQIKEFNYEDGRFGEVLEPSNVQKIVEKIKGDSRIKVETVTYLRWPLIIAALLFLLIDIAVRRVGESKNKKKIK